MFVLPARGRPSIATPGVAPKKGMAKNNEQKKPAAAPPTKKIYTKRWKTEFTGPMGGRWKLVRLNWDAIAGEVEEVWEGVT